MLSRMPANRVNAKRWRGAAGAGGFRPYRAEGHGFADAEAGWDPVLVDFQCQSGAGEIERAGVIVVVMMVVVMAGTEQPGAGDVHGQAEAGDGDGLAEGDRHGV